MMAPEAAKKPDFAAHPVCSGPYKFDSRVSQDRIVLTRFDNYWNKGAYHFDKIIYLPIPDASVRLANLRAGDLDLTEGIAASDVKTVEADSKLALAKVTVWAIRASPSTSTTARCRPTIRSRTPACARRFHRPSTAMR